MADESTRPRRARRERQSEVVSPARRLALRALIDAGQRNVFADRRLRELFAEEDPDREDRALATRLVQEVLRRRGELDFRLTRMMERGLGSVPDPIREILRLGLLQVLYFDRVPDHAAVDESVRLARSIGSHDHTGLVNAVLRRAVRGEMPELPEGDDDASLAVRHSFPAWLIRRWRRLGDDLVPALEGSNRTPDIVLRVNVTRTSVDRVRRQLTDLGTPTTPGRLVADCVRVAGRIDLETLPAFASGEVSVQDESEALVAGLVDALPSHMVLDVCAAPGGKSAHLYERANGLITLASMDIAPDRLRDLAMGFRRLHVRAGLVLGDGRRPPFATRFDRVLVDAPCTGTGVLARRAEARWRLDPDDPARCAEIQHELLERSAELVAPGGLLVYSVCSIEPEETRDVAEWFLAGHPDFREEPSGSLPAPARDEAGRLFLLPGAHGGDGVFGVRMRRIA